MSSFTDQKLIHHLQDFRKKDAVMQCYKSVRVSFLGPTCIIYEQKNEFRSHESQSQTISWRQADWVCFPGKKSIYVYFSITLKLWFVLYLNGAVTEAPWANISSLLSRHIAEMTAGSPGHLSRGSELVWITDTTCTPSLSSRGDERRKEWAAGLSTRAVPLSGLSTSLLWSSICHRYCCVG